MKLLTDVVADHDTSVTQILTAVRVIATRAGVPELAEWAGKEAGGYAQDDVLPPHRIWNLTIVADLHNQFQGHLRNVHVGAIALPEPQQQQATTYHCRDGVGELDALLLRGKGKRQPLGVEHPNLAAMVNRGPALGEGWICTHASAQFSPVHLMGIVTKARQTALTLCLECESKGIELRWLGNEADDKGDYGDWLRILRTENTKEGIKAVWTVIRTALFAAGGAAD